MDQLDEYEQGERVRRWLRDNGSSLLGGIALGLACIGGWQWWQGSKDKYRLEAASQYQALDEAIEAKDADKIRAMADTLAKEYADTGFHAMAVLRQVQYLQESGKGEDAVKLVDAQLPSIGEPAMAELLRLQAVRILASSGKAKEAGQRLDAMKSSERYPATFNELRGDIAMANGQREQARQAYEAALTTLDQAARSRPVLELKLIDAGGKPAGQQET
jgi:predicted negative regulator of RcsB-dependent stress response